MTEQTNDKQRDAARIEFHNRRELETNEHDFAFLDGYDAGRQDSDLQVESGAQVVDAVLWCPNCFEQHIDEAKPDVCELCGGDEGVHPSAECKTFKPWLNGPHKSHRCDFCNHVWRPVAAPTNGVIKLAKQGERDGFAQPKAFATKKDFDDAISVAAISAHGLKRTDTTGPCFVPSQPNGHICPCTQFTPQQAAPDDLVEAARAFFKEHIDLQDYVVDGKSITDAMASFAQTHAQQRERQIRSKVTEELKAIIAASYSRSQTSEFFELALTDYMLKMTKNDGT